MFIIMVVLSNEAIVRTQIPLSRIHGGKRRRPNPTPNPNPK